MGTLILNVKRRFPRFAVSLIYSLICLVLSACDSDKTQVTVSEPGVVAETTQREGDPEIGYQYLTETATVTCGLPLQAFLKTDSDGVARLPDRGAGNASLPYFFTLHKTQEDVPVVTNNCLSCHASRLFGELVIGLGNETLDFTVDQTVLAERSGALVEGVAEETAWAKWANRISTIAPYMRTDTVGVNPANNLTLALIAHRDPETLAWSDEPGIAPPPETPLPVSVPPWWRMKKKHSMFYTSEGRGDHARLMMTAALLCTDSVEEAARIDEGAPHLRAYLASIEPPAYPYTIDQEQAQQGQQLFEQTCSRCHGSYGAEGKYPNLIVPLAEIATDPELARRSVEDSDRFIKWYNESFFGELANAAPALGYAAPPLDGVWATAPFLHNGSVPTIEALLNSQIRPKYWKPSTDRAEYDQQRLGWVYQRVDTAKSAVPSSEAKFIYDTTLPGYANSGHQFGDHLSNEQRTAVLEYLKTL